MRIKLFTLLKQVTTIKDVQIIIQCYIGCKWPILCNNKPIYQCFVPNEFDILNVDKNVNKNVNKTKRKSGKNKGKNKLALFCNDHMHCHKKMYDELIRVRGIENYCDYCLIPPLNSPYKIFGEDDYLFCTFLCARCYVDACVDGDIEKYLVFNLHGSGLVIRRITKTCCTIKGSVSSTNLQEKITI